ncbi:MAG: cation transporter [Gammaproteobacteria bacterium]|nr:cation transporter [Gammaproteobacteria bacterium]
MSQSIHLAITGLTCSYSVEIAEEHLNAVEGVDFAVIAQDDSKAVVVGTASAETLIAAIEAAGYKAVEI